jgi:hypothetical protein
MAGFEIIVALLILVMCFTALQFVWFRNGRADIGAARKTRNIEGTRKRRRNRRNGPATPRIRHPEPVARSVFGLQLNQGLSFGWPFFHVALIT